MDHHDFGYSMKNVPLPSEKEYKLELLNSIHSFDNRMKWRAHHFLNPTVAKSTKETYGLNTSNSPPPIKELKALQDGLCEIARNIQFRDLKDPFQNKLRNDLRDIRNEEKIMIKLEIFIRWKKNNTKSYLRRI